MRQAVMRHDIDMLRGLIADGADVNHMINGAPPAYLAAQKGHTEMLELLIAAKADVNNAAKDGSTPAIFAAHKGHTEVLQLLIQAGADVDKADKKGITPAYAAVDHGQSKTLQLLIQAGANVDKADKDGYTPVYVAAFKGQIETLELLIQAGADVDKANKDGYSPVYAAAFEGQIETLQLLIQAGADVDKADKDGVTPAYVAAQQGQTQTLELLIQAGADVDKATKKGYTPADAAASKGQTEALKLLQKAGGKFGAGSKLTPIAWMVLLAAAGCAAYFALAAFRNDPRCSKKKMKKNNKKRGKTKKARKAKKTDLRRRRRAKKQETGGIGIADQAAAPEDKQGNKEMNNGDIDYARIAAQSAWWFFLYAGLALWSPDLRHAIQENPLEMLGEMTILPAIVVVLDANVVVLDANTKISRAATIFFFFFIIGLTWLLLWSPYLRYDLQGNPLRPMHDKLRLVMLSSVAFFCIFTGSLGGKAAPAEKKEAKARPCQEMERSNVEAKSSNEKEGAEEESKAPALTTEQHSRANTQDAREGCEAKVEKEETHHHHGNSTKRSKRKSKVAMLQDRDRAAAQRVAAAVDLPGGAARVSSINDLPPELRRFAEQMRAMEDRGIAYDTIGPPTGKGGKKKQQGKTKKKGGERGTTFTLTREERQMIAPECPTCRKPLVNGQDASEFICVAVTCPVCLESQSAAECLRFPCKHLACKKCVERLTRGHRLLMEAGHEQRAWQAEQHDRGAGAR